MAKTKIEWASHTWNPFTWNCTPISPGCKNCYALERSRRYKGKPSNGPDFITLPPAVRKKAWKELRKFPDGAVVFVNSHSDTYHEGVPIKTIHAIHQVAIDHPNLTFLMLTKRIERVWYMRHLLAFPPNLWIGTSIESHDYIWRLDYLADIPSAGRFVSAEPLIKPISFFRNRHFRVGQIDWVIVGAESGANRRGFSENWVRQIRDDCLSFEVPFMYKQGSHRLSGRNRFLDGRTWDETPFATIEPQYEEALPPEPKPIQIKLL